VELLLGAPDSDDAKSLLLCAVAAAAAELPDAALSGCSHARLRCLQRLLNCLASEIGRTLAACERPPAPEELARSVARWQAATDEEAAQLAGVLAAS